MQMPSVPRSFVAAEVPGWHPYFWRFRRLSPLRWLRFSRALDRMDCVVFDTETGGLDPDANPLLMLGAIVVAGGVPLLRFECRVEPAHGLVVEDAAVKVNGWTGPGPDDIHEAAAFDCLCEAFSRHPAGGRVPPMGHNVHFDNAVMRGVGRRIDRVWPPSFMSHRYIDTCAMASPLRMLGDVEERSLDGLCSSFGLSGALDREASGHRSPLADCYATLAVFYEMLWRLA